MKAQEFCYWLQGYFEISGINPETMLPKAMDCLQVQTVQRHLALVFQHDIDPKQGTPEHQAKLQAIHDGPPNLSKMGTQKIGPNGETITYRC